MENRIDAIYARQSVDRKDSISIESQIEFCKYELRGGNFKDYKDKGFSGKNTDRPRFQELMADIKRGLIRRVVVYKLDRISRSILDFATMMELFQQYNVEFVSSTEKFDTSTPMGRAMLNICIVFAQLERETIQKRVTDAYYSRCQRGFHMSGAAPYGFKLEHNADIQHSPAHRGGGIKLFRRGNELHIVLLEQLHHSGEVQDRTADTVQLVDHHPADQAPFPGPDDYR